MSTRVVAQPSYEPVSLAQARLWLKLEADETDEDATIRILIKAMRELAENLTGRSLIARQLELSEPNFHRCAEYGAHIELPFPPLLSVDAFKYIDTDGVLQTLDTDQYVVHSERTPAIIVPAWQVTWPTIRSVMNAVQITFTAGYRGSPPSEAEDQAVIPSALSLWMQARIGTLFENREQLITGAIVAALPRDFVDGLLDPLVVGSRLF